MRASRLWGSSLRLIVIAVLLEAIAAQGCSKSAATCPQSAKMVDGTCRSTCSNDFDCLQTERCDMTLGVCMPISSLGDGGASDAQPQLDATQPDASAGDARPFRRDAGDRKDADIPDLGIIPDAGAPDASAPDASVDCKTLGAQECTAQSTVCSAQFCPNCNAGHSFHACTDLGGPFPMCPMIDCTTCTNNTTEDACRATAICHPLFVDHPNCGCPTAGCCMMFSNCAAGALTICQATPILCDTPMPICELPYVNSYITNCYEGCVTTDECR